VPHILYWRLHFRNNVNAFAQNWPNWAVKRTPTRAMPSAFSWPLLVPYAPSVLRRRLPWALGHGLTQALETLAAAFCGFKCPAPLNMREWFSRRRSLPGKSCGWLRSRPGANLPIGSPRGVVRWLNLAVSPSAACSPSRGAQVPRATAKVAACPSAISTPVCAVSSPRHRLKN
jgi:hypothetical protein